MAHCKRHNTFLKLIPTTLRYCAMCKHNVKRKTQEKTVFQKSKCPCLKIVEHQEPVSRRNDTVASISFLWLLMALQRKYHSRKIKWSKKKLVCENIVELRAPAHRLVRLLVIAVSNARSRNIHYFIIHSDWKLLFRIWPKLIFPLLGVFHHQDSDLKDLEKQIMQSKRSKLLRESKENSPKVIRTPPGTNGRHRTRPGRRAELLEEIYI